MVSPGNGAIDPPPLSQRPPLATLPFPSTERMDPWLFLYARSIEGFRDTLLWRAGVPCPCPCPMPAGAGVLVVVVDTGVVALPTAVVGRPVAERTESLLVLCPDSDSRRCELDLTLSLLFLWAVRLSRRADVDFTEPLLFLCAVRLSRR